MSALAKVDIKDALADRVGYVLLRAVGAVRAELRARLADEDLHVSEAGVLQLVGDRKDIISSEIGKVFDIERANMVVLLDRLETAGLIQRVPLDKKKRAIVLTAAGREKLRKVNRITAQFESDLIAKVPVEHRKHLLPALKALWSWAQSGATR
jgi:DNA-binding MarR family transcriptional regulator